MYKCLEHFNFGNQLINWVKLFYNDAKSCISNNGNLSDFFNIQRGVRQGCPLSPYLFIICTGLRPIYVMFFKFLPISFQMKNNDEMWL